MRQPQNPPQSADNSSSDSPFAFLISHKNPYDHPGQASLPSTRYTSAYQSSYGDSERTTSLFIDANAALSIQKQLSSGWYSCYKWWLYISTVPNIFLFWSRISDSSTSLILTLKIIRLVAEVAYAVLMIDILKNKKLDRAGWGFKLAFALFVILTWQIALKALKVIEKSSDLAKEDLLKYFGIFLGCLLYYGLAIVFPAWKVKRLSEKRETLLQKDFDPYNI